MGMRPHKYIKRTGGPGTYRYWYYDPKTKTLREGNEDEQEHGKRDHARRLLAGRAHGLHGKTVKEMADEVGISARRMQEHISNMAQTARTKGHEVTDANRLEMAGKHGHDYHEHHIGEGHMDPRSSGYDEHHKKHLDAVQRGEVDTMFRRTPKKKEAADVDKKFNEGVAQAKKEGRRFMDTEPIKPGDDEIPWKDRFKLYTEDLKAGKHKAVAAELNALSKKRALSFGEKKVLDQAQEALENAGAHKKLMEPKKEAPKKPIGERIMGAPVQHTAEQISEDLYSEGYRKPDGGAYQPKDIYRIRSGEAKKKIEGMVKEREAPKKTPQIEALPGMTPLGIKPSEKKEEPKGGGKSGGYRSLREIGREIRKDWKKPYFGAVPYLDALNDLDTMDDKFGADDAQGIVAYLLGNLQTWKGETAKRVKAELKAMMAGKPVPSAPAPKSDTAPKAEPPVKEAAPKVEAGKEPTEQDLEDAKKRAKETAAEVEKIKAALEKQKDVLPKSESSKKLGAVDNKFSKDEADLAEQVAIQEKGGNPYVETAKKLFSNIQHDVKPERASAIKNFFAAVDSVKKAGKSVNEASVTEALGGKMTEAMKKHVESGTFHTMDELLNNPPLDIEVERMKRGYAAKQLARMHSYISDGFKSKNPDFPPPYPTFGDLKSWDEHGSRPSWASPRARTAVPKEIHEAAIKTADGKPQYPPPEMPIHLMPVWAYIVKSAQKANENPYKTKMPSFDKQGVPEISNQAAQYEGHLFNALRRYVKMRGGPKALTNIPSHKLKEAGLTHADIFKAEGGKGEWDFLKHKIIDPVALMPFVEAELKKKVKKSFALVVDSEEPIFKSRFAEEKIRKSLIAEIKRRKSAARRYEVSLL